jgi:hypothetical protein
MTLKQPTRRFILVFGVMAGFFTFASFVTAAGPNLKVSPESVEYKRGVEVTISGEGFKPKQEVDLWIMMGGVLSDLSFLIKPRPVADEQGKFKSVWKLNIEIRKKLLLPGTHTIEATDEDRKILAKAEFVLKKK